MPSRYRFSEKFGIARGVAPAPDQSRRLQPPHGLSNRVPHQSVFSNHEGLIYHLTSDNYCGGNAAGGGCFEMPEQPAIGGMFAD